MSGGDLVRIVPGLALPRAMAFLLEECRPSGATRKAVEAGHLLLIDEHPPYVELECPDPQALAQKARERGLRVYRARSHITISDGVYQARLKPLPR